MNKAKILKRLKIDEDYYGDFGNQFLSNSHVGRLLNDPLNVFKPIIEDKKPKYSSSNLKNEDAEKYLKKPQQIMKNDKPYLNEKLTISELAEMVGISRHHLTQILNEHLNKNFYTFINEYRVKQVKEMLLNENKKHYSILAIAYECGFNSKSTFNTLFKKYTGKTPSQFIKTK